MDNDRIKEKDRMRKNMRKTWLILMILILMFSLTGCYHSREKKYYSDTSNYITEEAIVKNIIFDKENNIIYFWLSEIDEAYQDSTFKIEGQSVNIVLNNNIFEKIKVGSEITYTSAPRYFGDGYCMPIVAIYIAGEELLNFDEGFENLKKLY